MSRTLSTINLQSYEGSMREGSKRTTQGVQSSAASRSRHSRRRSLSPDCSETSGTRVKTSTAQRFRTLLGPRSHDTEPRLAVVRGGGGVDGDPVDGSSDDELSAGEVLQQVGDHDVVGGHGHGGGEVRVQAPARGRYLGRLTTLRASGV